MTHTFCKQINPTFKFSQCKRPISSVTITNLRALSIFCGRGHHIRTKFYPSGEITLAIAKRLQNWIDTNKNKGLRVYPDQDGNLYLAEGDYGFDPKVGFWQCRPPGRHAGGLRNHQVVEHEDGTITVSPSILLTDFDEKGNQIQWHGYLERGIWREV